MKTPNMESVGRALLAQVEGIGPRVFENIIQKTDTVQDWFKTGSIPDFGEVNGVGETVRDRIQSKVEDWNIKAAAERLTDKGIGVISSADEHYPDSLREIYESPIVLFYRGNLDLLSTIRVAVVGTRRSTKYGEEFAETLSNGLTSNGITVVSGLAAGIDRASHEGALDTEPNSTIAVLGTGVDRHYPARNKKVQQRIGSDGLLLSEYPPGTEPKGEHFPERNRIISGLSRAVIVVQAAARSGALITADRALEQGRDVMAVPGRTSDSEHEGCHRLIKQGAALVENPEDVLDQLQLGGDFNTPVKEVSLSERESDVLKAINERPVHIDELVQQTQIEIGDCAEVLLELEEKGLIHGLPGQRYQRTQDAVRYEITED